jgi:hypothetical protein
MLRRIDWNARQEEEEEEEEDDSKPSKPPNYCHLVWQVGGQAAAALMVGVVQQRTYTAS